MPTPQPNEPIQIPEPDIIRPPTPAEAPQPDVPAGLPEPSPDIVHPMPPREIPPTPPQEVPSAERRVSIPAANERMERTVANLVVERPLERLEARSVRKAFGQSGDGIFFGESSPPLRSPFARCSSPNGEERCIARKLCEAIRPAPAITIEADLRRTDTRRARPRKPVRPVSVGQAHVYGKANPDLRPWCASRRLPLHAFVWMPRHGHAGIARGAFFLMRPDSYVALAQETASTETLDRYFVERGLSR